VGQLRLFVTQMGTQMHALYALPDREECSDQLIVYDRQANMFEGRFPIFGRVQQAMRRGTNGH
jgi:hypothetical protein